MKEKEIQLIKDLYKHFQPQTEVNDELINSCFEQYGSIRGVLMNLVLKFEPNADVTDEYLDKKLSEYGILATEANENVVEEERVAPVAAPIESSVLKSRIDLSKANENVVEEERVAPVAAPIESSVLKSRIDLSKANEDVVEEERVAPVVAPIESSKADENVVEEERVAPVAAPVETPKVEVKEHPKKKSNVFKWAAIVVVVIVLGAVGAYLFYQNDLLQSSLEQTEELLRQQELDANDQELDANDEPIDKEQANEIMSNYYTDLNNDDFNAHDYYAPFINRFHSKTDISPSEINRLIQSKTDYLHATADIIDNHIEFYGGNNSISYWTYWVDLTCWRTSREKWQHCNTHVEVGFNVSGMIVSYRELKVEDLIFYDDRNSSNKMEGHHTFAKSNVSNLNVRSTPAISDNVIGMLQLGDRVEVLDTIRVEEGTNRTGLLNTDTFIKLKGTSVRFKKGKAFEILDGIDDASIFYKVIVDGGNHESVLKSRIDLIEREVWLYVSFKNQEAHGYTQGYVYQKFLTNEPIELVDDEFIGKGDCYIIPAKTVRTKEEARKEVNDLTNRGYAAGFLWIPDFPSLSGAEYYSVFIGPFVTQKECELATEEYRKTQPNAYGLLVSQQNNRVEIRGVGKVSKEKISPKTEVFHEVYNTYMDQEAPYLILRSEPQSKSQNIAEMSDGTKLEVLSTGYGNKGSWMMVRVMESGKVGYAHSKWIRELYEN